VETIVSRQLGQGCVLLVNGGDDVGAMPAGGSHLRGALKWRSLRLFYFRYATNEAGFTEYDKKINRFEV
jgi:hypothetical protein